MEVLLKGNGLQEEVLFFAKGALSTVGVSLLS